MAKIDDLLKKFRVTGEKKFRLKDHDPAWTGEGKKLSKKEAARIAEELRTEDVPVLAEMQNLLYASDQWSVLLVFQAMDAAGKDGTIRHVMSGVNPQGCQVFSFKQPSREELDHNYLWRYSNCLPERGRIGIFNRSYYEEVLVVRVHPELVRFQRIPDVEVGKDLWKQRYKDIRNFEEHLSRNGTLVLKFFLNVSKQEQRRRFLDRINDPEKHWKFSPQDLTERGYWKQYMEAYEEAINSTSTKQAPWYVIPADNKWVTRALVAKVIIRAIKKLNLKYPEVGEEQLAAIEEARKSLEGEAQPKAAKAAAKARKVAKPVKPARRKG